MLVGEVRSATVPCAKANPVMAPQVLRLISAVACCHLGFLTDCMGITFFRIAGWSRSADLGRIADQPVALAPGKVLRMAWTCGFPGSVEFWNKMLASWESTDGAPTSHWL
jgi:hypothetical protein